MPSRARRILPSAVLASALFLAPYAASAIVLLPPCTASGNCGITDILAVFVNVAEILLGISGAVALFFFVLGGFRFILSGGNQEQVRKGLDTIKQAVIGIAIILLSGVIVRFAGSALTGKQGGVCTDADRRSGACVAVVGDFCNTSRSALWILMPAGYTQGKYVPAALACIPTDNCATLNSRLQDLGRPGNYSCQSISSQNAATCVRGLCSGGSGTACCSGTGQ